MKKKKLLFSLIVISLSLLTGCEKEPIRCILPNTTTSSNSPVVSGTTIVLNTPAVTTGTYHWTGPNGFESNVQNPTIPNATASMTGEYKLKITKGICESEEVATTVEVIVNTATCSQDNDTATFSGAFYDYSFYYNTANAIANDQYQMYAGGSQADIFVTFDGNDTPAAGVYTIVNKSTPLSDGQVHLKTIISDVLDYYAKSGDVVVSYDNGKAVVKFCSVSFSFSTNTSTDNVGSALFTENQ